MTALASALVAATFTALATGCTAGEDADGGLDATAPQSLTGARPDDSSGRGVRGEPAAPGASPSAEPSAPDTPAALPTFSPGSTVGGLAPGFPKDLFGTPDGATVLASSVSPGDGRLTDITLNLAAPGGVQEAIDQVTDPLRKKGFDESGTAAFSGLTAQTSFTRTTTGDDPVVETVVLGVLDDGDRRLVTVSGSVVL